MKKNYLSGFFKSFGIIPFIAGVILFVVVAYVGVCTNFVSEQMLKIMAGGVLGIMAGGAVLGLTGLKSEKIGFADFIRCVVAVSSLIIAITVMVAGGHLRQSGLLIIYCAFILYFVLILFLGIELSVGIAW